MELPQDEIIKKYGRKYGHCDRNILLPYDYEWTCFGSGYKVIKRKNELYKYQRKRINFIN